MVVCRFLPHCHLLEELELLQQWIWQGKLTLHDVKTPDCKKNHKCLHNLSIFLSLWPIPTNIRSKPSSADRTDATGEVKQLSSNLSVLYGLVQFCCIKRPHLKEESPPRKNTNNPWGQTTRMQATESCSITCSCKGYIAQVIHHGIQKSLRSQQCSSIRYLLHSTA